MKEKIKITREELLEILGVTNNNLKTIIKRKQLYERLKQKPQTVEKIQELYDHIQLII